ncbi:TetR/AcrR family transcriptional regulator [Paenibacillus sp. CGMCC 1.16610]|nr:MULTISPECIES: TetR/AcrR family transcriptional regulator [Paenibacillus]MBA2937582.1 TetR/AcrR family transcriptional regulator [Paenibacillus sp. CGMCC 1.16610]
MARVSKKPEIRRQEMIDASLELFSSKGYEQTAVSDIVKKLGVAQGTFYYHFKTKSDIMAAIIESLVTEKVNTISALTDSNLTTEDKLHKIIWGEEPGEEESKMLEFLHHENNAFIHQKILVQTVQQSVPYVIRILEQGVTEGIFRIQHLQETAEILLMGIHFMFDPGIFTWSEDTLKHKKLAFQQVVERMLGDSFAFSQR